MGICVGCDPPLCDAKSCKKNERDRAEPTANDHILGDGPVDRKVNTSVRNGHGHQAVIAMRQWSEGLIGAEGEKTAVYCGPATLRIRAGAG